MTLPSHANQALLDTVAAAALWIRARKIGAIRARRLGEATLIQTPEGPATARAGDFECRSGQARWPQTAARVTSMYEADGDPDERGWCRYIPRPDAYVMAARIDRDFEVDTIWGTHRGRAGDYLLKAHADRAVAYPPDVWIVRRCAFEQDYERVDSP